MRFVALDRGGSHIATSRATSWSKLRYYARSLVGIGLGFRQTMRVFAMLVGVGRGPREVALRRSGLRFRVRDALDLWILKEVCLDEDYLPGWVRLEPSFRVLDVGGGVGDFAVWAASQCEQGVVHTYEPHHESFRLLLANIDANQSRNVEAHPEVVAARDGRRSARAGSRHAVETSYREHEDPGGVAASSLETALDRLPGGACDFMKIDCEGGELEILLDSDPDLLRRVARISLEYHDGVTGRGRADLIDHLEAHGFRLWEKPSPVHRSQGLLYAERLGVSADS